MTHPKISIIIPSYNYGRYIEKAIQSVINQDYPNVEFIILDGGSSDNTVDIIKQYEEHISFWRSEPDESSNTTVNEGFAMATGDIVGLLCADDWYEEGVFHDVAKEFTADKDLDILSFYARFETEEGETESIATDSMDMNVLGKAAPNGRFYRKYIFDNYGALALYTRAGEYMLCTDWEMMIRFSLMPIKHKLMKKVGYTYLLQDASFSMGAGHHLILEKTLEEYVEIISRYVGKSLLYSHMVNLFFLRFLTTNTVKLYMLKNMLGKHEEAEYYKKIGTDASAWRWHFKYFRLKRKKSFLNELEKIKEADNTRRVQTIK